jgi:hypothetical protein
MSEVDLLLSRSFIGMETRPSKLLVQDQVLQAKLKVGKKKAETIRPLYVMNQESTDYDKLAMAMVEDYMGVKEDPKIVAMQTSSHVKDFKVVGA